MENASNVESNQIAEKESIMFFCVQSNGLMWKLNVRMSARADFNLTNLPSQPNLKEPKVKIIENLSLLVVG